MSEKKGSNKLAKYAGVFAGTTLISRIMGFLRDMLMGSVFGASAMYDAFLVAFKIPNILRALFGEGAFTKAFVPMLAEYQTHSDPHDIKQFVDRVSGSLAFILFWVTLIGVLTAPWLIYIFAPGFRADASRLEITVNMLRITFPYIFFISLTGFAGSIFNVYGKFGIPGFTPVLLNLAMIIGALYATPYFEEPILALAWSVFVAGILQLLFQVPFLIKLKMLPRFHWGFGDPAVKRLLVRMVPVIFGASVAQINLFINTMFASFLPIGSISWLYFAERFMEFPLGIFGVALSTAVLPQLTREFSVKKSKQYSTTLDWALRNVCIIGIPAAIGLAVLAGPLITTMLHYGAFKTVDVLAVTPALQALAMGVWAFMSVKILAGAYYARQDVATPVKIAACTVVVNILLNLLLMESFAHIGLALATALSGTFNATILMSILFYKGYYRPLHGWGKLFLQILVAIAAMVVFLWATSSDIEKWFIAAWWERALHLFGMIAGAAIVYFLALRLCGVKFRKLTGPEQVQE